MKSHRQAGQYETCWILKVCTRFFLFSISSNKRAQGLNLIVINAAMFGESISLSILTTTTVTAVPAPHPLTEQYSPPPSLWQCHNHHHRIFRMLQCRYTRHLHARNGHLRTSHTAPCGKFRCRSHWRIGEREGNDGQGQSQRKRPPQINSARSGSPYLPVWYAAFEDDELHTAYEGGFLRPMQLRATHQGYRLRGHRQGVNQYGSIRRPSLGRLPGWVC